MGGDKRISPPRHHLARNAEYMASPQKENGFTPIANEILEHLSWPGINGSEYRIIILIIRKTYGFNKKEDKISFSQFQKYTLMNRSNAIRTIQSLVAKRILVKTNNVYKFNKNWEEWVVAKRIPSPQTDTKLVPKRILGVVAKRIHTKDIIKDNTKDKAPDGAGVEINYLISLFKEVNPSIGKYYGIPPQRKAIERMIKEHGREKLEDMIKVLPQVNARPYWPKSTTPIELENNLGKYKALNESDKNKKSDKIKVAIII